MPSLREKIGQMIMIGIQGEELAPEEKSFFKDYPVGGFILFGHNLKAPAQILALCRSLWEIKDELPPFIAIDQEGGRVHRLPPPFTHFPPAAEVGRAGDSELAYRAGLAMAGELKSVGVNLNFAPVFDVATNPKNPVIGDRALSSEPNEVFELGWEIARGLREGGVIPCIKHFPGHGGTDADSHVELPVVDKEIEDLQATELVPFAQACGKRVEAVMTAHVMYPALDRVYPATLSPKIIGELLRGELRYDGVVFSDDLEMKAVSEKYSGEEAAALAVAAGVDELLFCHDSDRAAAALDDLCRRAAGDQDLVNRIEESYRRIRKLKKRTFTGFSGASEDELADLIGMQGKKIAAEILQGRR
ncbi:MAG TPA: beta-N-acetylhexosaminidase [Verrucomicrobiae bacterium]|jgi:beta-N-acetylhexosaminidase|nr:beta-N-acetylhexosaminidase [Verrucomicrobiae bacterium]